MYSINVISFFIFLVFRIDLTLELVDKEHISRVKVAKILNIIGKRLELRYYDNEEQGEDIFHMHSLKFSVEGLL